MAAGTPDIGRATGRGFAAPGGIAWWVLAGVLGLLGLGVWLLPAPAQALLDWRPALAWSEPWRWITAAGVHLSPAHLGLNLAGTAAVAAFGAAAGCGRRDAAAWALAWPATHGLLLAWPSLGAYGGASGVLHAGMAVACVALLRRSSGLPRAIGAAISIGLLAKLAGEQPWLAPVQQQPEGGFAVAVIAHACGVAAGTLAAGVAWATDRGRTAKTIPR